MYNNEPIFLSPVFKERIWGGNKLNTLFGYDIPNEQTGEAWVISAHENGSSMILNGPLQGETLKETWEKHPALFGKTTTDEDFPLLVKILDANADLSVQVHPDDMYAKEIEGESYGKTECWYVLDADTDAKIIFGHHAASKADFLHLVEQGDWDRLLRHMPVSKGDFIYVPSGTIHAIGKGIVILETQQSSDITYRVYDYNRTDAKGNTRELHIQSSAEVTHYPHHVVEQEQITEIKQDLKYTLLIQTTYFTVYHWELNGNVETPLQRDFLLMSVIEGQGEILVDSQTFSVQKGDNLMLPATIDTYELKGKLEMIVSYTT